MIGGISRPLSEGSKGSMLLPCDESNTSNKIALTSFLFDMMKDSFENPWWYLAY